MAEDFMPARTFLLLLFLSATAAAQFDSLPSFGHRVRVHINFSDGARCDSSTRVSLMKSPSESAGTSVTDQGCMTEFFGIPAGNYYLNISGRGFASFDSTAVVLTSPDTERLEVTVRRPVSQDSLDTSPSAGTVAMSDLNVPKAAAKEFSKATEQMERGEWTLAVKALNRAIAIHPRFAAAYNNLGVAYAHLGNRRMEADALNNAIAINRRLEPAYINLARMHIAQNEYADAQLDLATATGIDPTNSVAVVLLAYSQYMDHRLDEAIASCNRVHDLQNGSHAGAHWVAAFALEQKNQIAQAKTEFETFVKEESGGVRADAARREIAHISEFLSEEPGQQIADGTARKN
jgi:tetratricopeptide (TPR) repeat protein